MYRTATPTLFYRTTGHGAWVYNAEPIFPASPRQILLAIASEAVVLTSCAPNTNSAGISIHDGHALWARQEPFTTVPSLAVAGQTAYYDRNG